jgi:hypothetical protein
MSEAPINLYFDLERGQSADMEVAAKAALAFADALREIVYSLDPTLTVRVELASGTPGSLSLNAVVRAIKEAKDRPLTVGTAAIIAILWLTGEVGSWTVNKVLDHLTGPDAPPAAASLSEQDRADLADRIARKLNEGAAKRQVQQVFREAERDPAIKGVGASAVHGHRPTSIVPRREFARRAGVGIMTQQTTTRRTFVERMHVELISPVLVQGDRRWRFRGPKGEFGAPMKDIRFAERVLSGTTTIPMVAGIEMEVEVEITEELRENGVWASEHIEVVQVLGLRAPYRQTSLPFASSEIYQADDSDESDDRSQSG